MAENNSSSNGAVPPTGAFGTSEGKSPSSIQDYLDFDPFEPADAGKAAEPPSDEPAPVAAGDALPPESQPKEQPGEAAKPPPQAPDPVLRELARINETLAASQQPRYAPAGGTPATPPPRFNLEIPQQILKAVIHSEDPEERAVGLAALVNGLANTLYNDISSEFRQQQERLYQALPQMHQRLSQEQVEQQRAAQDFFGTFQNLRPTPQMMQFVAGEAKALAVEQWQAGNRNLQWNQAFRDALGRRIHESLGLPMPGAGAQAPARVPKRPQFAAGGDAKGGNVNAAPNQEVKEIWDVFGYN